MNIYCAIIDDEPLAADLLRSYVKKTPYLELVGVYDSAIKAMAELRDMPVQLLFLDIQMPELSGIEFAKILTGGTRVIFTTAFPQYACESYKVNALDYLLKPISYNDFRNSTDKAMEWFLLKSMNNNERFLFVKSDYKLQRILLDDILYIEGLKDYVRFYLKNGDKIMSLMSMKKLYEFLPKPEFLRTHRSYIVHMPEVSSVDRYRIAFGDTLIPVSDNCKDEVQAYLDDHTLM